MGLGDTLEKLFNVETETSIESAAMEFVTAGPNIESKTILPFTKPVMAISFLQRLAQDIDQEMKEVTDIYNQTKLDDIREATRDWKPTKRKIKEEPYIAESYRYERLSDNIYPVINKAMVFMPSVNGKSREQLESVLKWLREEKSKQFNKGDSISQVKQLITR